MKTVEINNKDDFGDTHHMVSTEVYFYDSAYQLVKRQQALPVDKQGKCVVAEITVEKNKNKKASSSEGKPAASNNSNASNKKSKEKKIQWKYGPALVSVKP